MKQKKNLLAFFIIGLMSMGFISCGGDDDDVMDTIGDGSYNYTAKFSTELGYIGKVKTVAQTSYNSQWDNEKLVAIKNGFIKKEVSFFDERGWLYRTETYGMGADGTPSFLKVISDTEIDGRNRITSKTRREFFKGYDKISVSRYTIDYNDRNMEATYYEYYSWDEDTEPLRATVKRVFKLTSEGFIDPQRYKEYSLKASGSNELKNVSCVEQGLKVISQDDRGNCTEGYFREIYYNSKLEKYSGHASDYYIFAYTYY